MAESQSLRRMMEKFSLDLYCLLVEMSDSVQPSPLSQLDQLDLELLLETTRNLVIYYRLMMKVELKE